MEIAATSPAAAPVAGSNPWESDIIRNAVATLNRDGASIDERLTAYKAISDLIAGAPSHGGPSRVAVVTDEGYARFAAMTSEVGHRLNRGAVGLRDSAFTYRQAANFDAMSADEQLVLARLSPFGTAEDFRAHLQANADVGRAVEQALAAGGHNHISQVTDRRLDGLKRLVMDGYAADRRWTERAQTVLSALAAPAPQDKVELSPAARALAQLRAPVGASEGEAALRMLRASEDRAARPYEPGAVESRRV